MPTATAAHVLPWPSLISPPPIGLEAAGYGSAREPSVIASTVRAFSPALPQHGAAPSRPAGGDARPQYPVGHAASRQRDPRSRTPERAASNPADRGARTGYAR